MPICAVERELPVLGRFGIGVKLGPPLDPKFFNTVHAEFPLGKYPIDSLTGGTIAKVISDKQVVKLAVDGEYSSYIETAVQLTGWEINNDQEVRRRLCWIPEAYPEVTLSEQLHEFITEVVNRLKDFAYVLRNPRIIPYLPHITREQYKAELSSHSYCESDEYAWMKGMSWRDIGKRLGF